MGDGVCEEGGAGNGPDRIATESRPSSSVGWRSRGRFKHGIWVPSSLGAEEKYIFRTFFVPAAAATSAVPARSLNKSRKVEDVERRKLGDHKAEGGTKGEGKKCKNNNAIPVKKFKYGHNELTKTFLFRIKDKF